MVLIDSSVWIDFFRRKTGMIGDAVESLLDADRVALCGVVEMEILHGLRPHEQKTVEAIFHILHYAETERQDFIAAGQQLAELRRAGITIPATDALIGAVCKRHALSLFSLDKHFDYFPGIQRFTPIF